MIYILDLLKEELVEAEITPVDLKNIPLKKNGWQFNWSKVAKDRKGQTFVLRTLNSPETIEGALNLTIEHDMLIMNALELAPHNVGTQHKRYDYVAGCLIAFACRESFKLESNYKGFLTFVAKSRLIQWYMGKYGAQLAIGQRMFIDWETGEELIKKYLQRTKID